MFENVHQSTNSQIITIEKSILTSNKKSMDHFEFISNQSVVHDYLTSYGDNKSIVSQRNLIDFFKKISDSTNGFEEVYIFNKDGSLSFVQSKNYLYNHNKDNLWLNQLVQRSGREGMTTVEKSERGYVFAYTIQVIDSEGTVLGYLIGTENLNYISNWFTASNQNDITGMFLMHNGEIINSSGLVNSFKIKDEMSKHEQKYESLVNNFYQVSNDSKEADSMVYVEPGPYGLKIGLISSTKDFNNIQNFLIKSSAVIIGIITLIIIALVFFLIKTVVINRLSLIKAATQKMTAGIMDVQLPVNQKDELGEVMRNFNDMSDRINTSYEQIHDLAYFDELTGLNNKSYFKEELSKTMTNLYGSEEIALLSIDLDDFKSINDLHGHQLGDEYLKVIADRIKQIAEEDTENGSLKYTIFVARLAGDEFSVILKGKNVKSYSERVSKKIIASISDVMHLNSIECYPSCSIGIAIYPTHANDKDELFRFSDITMYEAKNSGKNKFLMFESEMVEGVLFKEAICKEIKIAIEHDAFELYLQPKHDVKNNCFNKFESLIRWNHKERGFISPGVFIPIAEESNLIVEIGNWVLKQTCKNIRTFEMKGWENFKVSFNVSPQQLNDRNFAKKLKECIRIFNIKPEHLEIEVTEHSFAKNQDLVVKELEKVRELGVSVALDDFGTGYSSLEYIKMLPLDVVKLDRSFVSQAKKCEVNLVIIQAVLNIADALNLMTVAEGVETLEEFELMKELNVDYIQGFYFAKPMPMEDIMKMCDLRPERNNKPRLVIDQKIA